MNEKDFLGTVMPFKDKMFRLALRLLNSQDEAEDAAQEVFIKLWNKKEDLAEYRSVEAMAMTMTRNWCLDKIKSSHSKTMTLVHSNFSNNEASVAKKTELKDSLSHVEQIVSELPENQRVVIQLRDIEQYEYEEIAEVTGMSPATIRVTLSRARKSVREALVKRHNYGIEGNRNTGKEIPGRTEQSGRRGPIE